MHAKFSVVILIQRHSDATFSNSDFKVLNKILTCNIWFDDYLNRSNALGSAVFKRHQLETKKTYFSNAAQHQTPNLFP